MPPPGRLLFAASRPLRAAVHVVALGRLCGRLKLQRRWPPALVVVEELVSKSALRFRSLRENGCGVCQRLAVAPHACSVSQLQLICWVLLSPLLSAAFVSVRCLVDRGCRTAWMEGLYSPVARSEKVAINAVTARHGVAPSVLSWSVLSAVPWTLVQLVEVSLSGRGVAVVAIRGPGCGQCGRFAVEPRVSSVAVAACRGPCRRPRWRVQGSNIGVRRR